MCINPIFRFLSLLLLIIMFHVDQLQAQTIWNGAKLTFTKENDADWKLPAHQDRITDSVWITRKHNQGIYNIAQENGYQFKLSPVGTEWAYGTTANLASLTFASWEEAVESNPVAMINRDMVLHLLAEDIYIDIKFLNWASGGLGGAFSYERSTDQPVGIPDFNAQQEIKIYPNPVQQHFSLEGLHKEVEVVIYDVMGRVQLQQIVSNQEVMDVSSLNEGVYYLRIPEATTLPLVKIEE